ncbi:hypothetical protein V5O48_015387 [Marasmius crinis-equi]|uniref:Peroxidase n=1 Tax=Marasmius crinis-equi TaxID=585013 RepID=A0ABR3EUP5_9AGAR
MLHALSFFSLCVLAGAYRWPSPQIDYLEKLLYEGRTEDPRIEPLDFIGHNCGTRLFSPIAAQLIRLAYHDMATHNVDDGTGGLDASIRFEIRRDENIGDGNAFSLDDFHFYTTPFVSMADIIALGTVLGVVSCDGPVIPYRGGRIDAISAGPPGVPQPHEDLASHTESFRRQGFTNEEMIKLVACGHTVGGVQSKDFPTVVSRTEAVGVFFDKTNVFDSAVVTEYLNGTIENALVVGRNSSTNSDARIFGSDGNVTMNSIAASEAFSKACSDLLGRMINTVPKTVQLTEVINPFPIKVGKARLSISGDGSLLQLNVTIRLLEANPNRSIKLFYTSRYTGAGSGNPCSSTGCSADPISSTGITLSSSMFTALSLSPVKYTFSVGIDPVTSISRFWFVIDGHDVVDNEGTGYEIPQDMALFDAGRSTRTRSTDPANRSTSVRIAVRNSSPLPSRVYIDTYDQGDAQNSYVPGLASFDLRPDVGLNDTVAGMYRYYVVTIPDPVVSFDAHVDVDGQTFTEEHCLTGDVAPKINVYTCCDGSSYHNFIVDIRGAERFARQKTMIVYETKAE